MPSPVPALSPCSGSSTKTRSPSDSWAWSVMPRVTEPSSSRRSHSWSLVYFRSPGTSLISLPPGRHVAGYRLVRIALSDFHFAVAHERRPDDTHGQVPPADIHRQGFFRPGIDAGERDRSADSGAEAAARDLADRSVAGEYRLVIAQHAPALQHEPHETARHPGFLLPLQRRTADEVPPRRVEGHGPAEVRFQRCRRLIHVRAVEVEAGLQPQRVARAETAGLDA